MSEAAAAHRWTVEELEALPGEEGCHYEIIDGELFVSKSPRNEHQATKGGAYLELSLWNRQAGLGEVLSEPGVIFSRHDAVEPDVVWLSLARRAAIERDDGHLHGAPELVVEVLSPGSTNERRDREIKLALYSRYGVDEYWILDWRVQSVTVYRRQENVMRLAAALDRKDELTSPLLPGFAVRVGRLFARP
jgi:Uma2 family endonuclease